MEVELSTLDINAKHQIIIFSCVINSFMSSFDRSGRASPVGISLTPLWASFEVMREQTTKHLTIKVLFNQTKTAKTTEESIGV